MLLVTARVVSRPDTRDQTRDALVAMEGPTQAEKGCLGYTWYVCATEPEVFSTIERWESREHLDAHLQTPHVKAVLAAAGDLVAEAPVISVHEVSASSEL